MNFLVVLAAWALLQWRGPATPLHRDHWVHFWFLRASAALSALPLALRLALIVISPALLVWAVAALLEPLLAGLLLFLFALAVLSYSLGRGDYRARVEAYLERWQRGDHAAAYEEALVLGMIHSDDPVGDPLALHRSVRRALLYQGYERWFAVVFWFVLLGPGGALAYRLGQLLRSDAHASADERRLLTRWIHFADWIPARLLGLTFALAGNFSDCFKLWCDSWQSPAPADVMLDRFEQAALSSSYNASGDEGRSTPEPVSAPGSEAMDGSLKTGAPISGRAAATELRQILTLLGRSAIGWLIVLAVVQLI